MKRSSEQTEKMFLTYHTIQGSGPTSIYSVSSGQFETHVRVATEKKLAEKTDGKEIRFTFDDGHVSNYEYAFPILEKYSQRAIFFVTVDFIGKRQSYMDWNQLRELVKYGHEVQSHSLTHPLLTHCTDAELKIELECSKTELEKKLQRSVEALAVPGGRWDNRVLHAAADAGYLRVYVSDPWIGNHMRAGIQIRGRLTVKRDLRVDQLQKLVAGKNLYATTFRMRYEMKELLRRAMGDRIYRSLWTSLSSRNNRKSAADGNSQPSEI